MNSLSFQDFLKTYNAGLSRYDFKIYAVALIAVSVFTALSKISFWGGTLIAPAINTMDIISFMFAVSLPIFLGAGLLFSTNRARGGLLALVRRYENPRNVILIRFLLLFMIVSIYVSGLILVISLYQLIRVSFTNLNAFAFIPAMIVSALLVSFILTAIATSMTLALEDWKVVTVIGCAFSIILATVAGWNAESIRYSIVRELALLSPHNLYRVLGVMLTGYEFESPNQMQMYLGIQLDSLSLVVPLLGWFSISMMSLVFAFNLFQIDLHRWRTNAKLVESDDALWIESVPYIKSDDNTRESLSLRRQKQMALAVILSFLILVSFAGTIYTNAKLEESIQVLYESPSEGETLCMGLWFTIEVYIRPPPSGYENEIRWDFNILDWGECPDTVRMQYCWVDMTLDEFMALNDTTRANLSNDLGNKTKGSIGGVSGNTDIENKYGNFVFGFLISDPINNTTHALLTVSFIAEIRAE
jgi:hypothetical protein